MCNLFERQDAKNKMDWVNTLKSTAGSCLFREQWDGALEKVEEAKGVLAELSQVQQNVQKKITTEISHTY